MGVCLLMLEFNALREKIRLEFGRFELWVLIGFGFSPKISPKKNRNLLYWS
ncbi:uncharacterized protein DS421_9g278130 [Arachis hypogaea]|nr:uncharacterized protein DS421_9g278130 [Arachis hypogaea]